jgi:alcohol dehydrogenase class IV
MDYFQFREGGNMKHTKRNLISSIQADWTHPTEIRFGVGRMKELPDACRKLNMHTSLLVTDPGVARLPFLKKAIALNQNEGIETRVFSEIISNPDSICIKQGARIFQEGQFDGILAVGGGSALDAGKAIALVVAAGSQDFWKYVFGTPDIPPLARVIPPVIAIPTTAGTGSEVDANAVITDEVNHVKRSLYHPKLLPRMVIADPALTQSLPPSMTAATGMDALSHNLEALCSPIFNPMLDAIAYQGIHYIKDWLPIVFQESHNLQARLYMMAASIMGAIAFEKGLGAMHALAHAVGAMFQTHHGSTIAAIMPYVLKFNRRKINEKMEYLAWVLDLSRPHFDAVLQWILALRQELGMPHFLGALGVKEEHIPFLAEKALRDGNASTNPILLDRGKVEMLLNQMICGK